MRIFLFSILFSVCVPLASIAKNHISVTTRHTQLVFLVEDNNRLYQTYLGERLSDNTPLEALGHTTVFTQTAIKGFEVYPVMGTEDYYEPALEITHADGNPTSVLEYVSHQQYSVKGGTETVICLADKRYPLTVDLHYLAYKEEDVIKAWSVITSQEKGDVYLSRYASAMLYFQCGNYYLRHFSSDWAKEMQQQECQLNFGRKTVDTRLGSRADLFAQPFFEVGLDHHITENEGTVLMGSLAWMGNFRFTFEVDHDGILRVISGINPDASRYLLTKGRPFTTPELVFTLSQHGIGQGSRNLHKWLTKYQLYKGDEDRLTLLNNWENTYFDFDEAKLVELFGEAKDLGVDMFLLDDGWFGNKYPRQSDNAGLGDWQVTRSKLPNGLPYLVRTAKEKGVEFGLWVEPEMVNPKSELAEKHPDWILRLPDRETYYFRNQLVLDLGNPQVQEFVFSVIDGIMQENPSLKFFKWDCNSPITNIFSVYQKNHQGNLYVDYTLGLYRVLERIQQKYPQLFMMMCSGGGGRSDYSGLKYFTEFWCSDNTDPIERLFIQWGYSQFMPAKVMCAHVTEWNRRASVKFRLDVAFACKMGFDIGLKKMNKADREYCRQAIKEYNRLKPVIFANDLYRLVSPYEGNHCALMHVSPDKSHAVLLAYDIHPRYGEVIIPTRLQGLDPSAQYRVKEICLMPGAQSWLSCNDKVYTGSYLMQVGLRVLSSNDMVSHIIEITKE